jgi:putative membrane protein
MLLEHIPVGYVVREARRDALTVLVIASVVELLVAVDPGMVPKVNLVVPSLLGTAISLILSFKFSQSYERWWEARKIWGAIVNDSRTLVRQLLTFTVGSRELTVRMARRQIAWCYSLGQCLRGQDWRIGSEGQLSQQDEAEAAGHTNKPLALTQQQARDLALLAQQQQVSDYQRVAIDDTLTRLTDSMGKAERIRSTVFPATYRLFLHWFIYLFITLFSLALGEIKGAWQVLVTLTVAIPFFLLEKTAVHLQDPFSNRPTDTAMTAIARTIEINLLQLIGAESVPQPLAPERHYLL